MMSDTVMAGGGRDDFAEESDIPDRFTLVGVPAEVQDAYNDTVFLAMRDEANKQDACSEDTMEAYESLYMLFDDIFAMHDIPPPDSEDGSLLSMSVRDMLTILLMLSRETRDM